MTEKAERYIKRQIRIHLANIHKIDNLNHVSETEIDEVFESKETEQYTLKMDELSTGETYFAFVDKETGLYYMTAIIGGN